MDYEERKREEEKEKLKKKKFPVEEAGKECLKCHTINELEARYCEECGYKFFEDKEEVRRQKSEDRRQK